MRAIKYRVLWYKTLGIGECIGSDGSLKFFTALTIKPLGHIPRTGDIVEFICAR